VGPGFTPRGIVTFLSDFGTRDSYAAEVRGAILSVDPGLRVIDVTHEIARHDVRDGAWVLARTATAFPPGTVHLAVVDPGVGTSRRAVAVEAGGHVLVGPDNGLLGWAASALGGADGAGWREIDAAGVPARNPISLTFHGRDLLGPAAAAIASGRVAPGSLGRRIDDPVVVPFPAARVGTGEVLAEVVRVDGFGNLILAVRASDLPPGALAGEVSIVPPGGATAVPAVSGPYGTGGGLVVHEDSSGYVEVAVPGGSAAERLGARAGTRMALRWR